MKDALLAADGGEIRRAFDADGTYSLIVEGETITLEPDDVEIRAVAHESLAVVQDGPVAVALDTTLTDELRREGLARELVRALNDHRKARDFALSDRIAVVIRAQSAVFAAAEEHGDWIAGEVLAVDWTLSDAEPAAGDSVISIDGAAVGLAVEKASA